MNPKNTSRECSECGYTDKVNRKDQEHFECVKCGFAENADINAAINISRRPEKVTTKRVRRLDSTNLIAVRN